MAEAGFNVVRLAEFAWSKMEPKEGHYDFSWLDYAIDILSEKGIKVVLGTPTASPPPWLMTKHPEVFLIRQDGRLVTYGNRRNYSPNSAVYQDYTRRIVTAVAEHYKDHPAVIGWQIDNEFGDRDYNARAFRSWLKERFGSLDIINERWGTMFWSHVYTDWDEIPVPVTTGGHPNPGLALDFYRFCSESYVDYQRVQIEILRQHCPGHFITHNFMGFGYDLINYFDLAKDLDFVAWDNYPRGFWDIKAGVDPSRMALGHGTMRGLKDMPFWVMEQQSGPGGWDIISVAPKPGELRLWAYQAVAHGADALVFFRWRTARHGTEQYWHGLLEHDARPGRRYEEIKQMGQEIKAIGARLVGATTKADVAMMLSYDSRFAFQIQPNNPRFSYPEQFLGLYRALYKRHMAVDVVPPDADLSKYKIVIVPSLYVLTEETATSLERFVQNGGTLLITPRTGVKDESNTVVNQALPGLISRLCGVIVEDYDSLPADLTNPLEFDSVASEGAHGRAWCDILAAEEAEVVARYGENHYAGKPAVTVNTFGQGKAVYVGTMGNEALYETLADLLLTQAGVEMNSHAPEGIEITRRYLGDQALVFVLNHSDSKQVVKLDKSYRSLLGAAPTGGTVTLSPKDVVVLEEETHA
jgi:beta-galactosidase